MRMSRSTSDAEQLELLDAQPHADDLPTQHEQPVRSTRPPTRAAPSQDGRPLIVPLGLLDEDPNNPRTEFPDAELEELADDIRQRGILQPIVVHPADAEGRYRIHFGAKRYRAARRAGLEVVPVVVRDAAADPYAQVAENHKRHGLTALDLARFIQGRANAGESNAAIAQRLAMDLTTVAHHLALLDLPPDLDEALKSGRCTSPKTLHELSKLHQEQPGQAKALLARGADITRAAVVAARATAVTGRHSHRTATSLLTQANRACSQLELTLARIEHVAPQLDGADLAALRQRVAKLAGRSA
jgi:ParB family transcriptional regulator, chromosome partitioning protein